MPNDLVLRVENLGKRYKLAPGASGAPAYRTLREEIFAGPREFLRRRRKPLIAPDEEFWALRDVSFEVRTGEVVGVIGRNGAGKSTLLKILSRIVAPTTGSADVFGRVGSLLEVGTGFHPELTGRENIFLSGAILGMRRAEIRARFHEIVAFAEVETFVDEPVKRYSSGMYARLAFSVAMHLAADVVLMDEVLAVGDADFRRRCRSRVMETARERERTILIVSHEPALIRTLCSRALLVDKGRIAVDGTPESALREYHSHYAERGDSILDMITRCAPGLRIDSVLIGESHRRRIVLAADCTSIEIQVTGQIDFAAQVSLEVRLRDQDGNVLALCSPGHDSLKLEKLKPGPFAVRHRILLPRLLRGRFGLALSLTDPNLTGWVEIPDAAELEVEGSTTRLGLLTAGSHCGWMLLESEPCNPRGAACK